MLPVPVSVAVEVKHLPSYRLAISCDRDIWLDGNDGNDDCELGNHRLQWSGAAINELF